MEWDGGDYQRRMARAAQAQRETGGDPHGEVAFVERFEPDRVLDAGCGTGRVAVELTNRGIPSVGVDVSASMLAAARAAGPAVEWVEADLCTFDLGRQFPVVVMAGNVPLFTPPGTQAALVARVATHVAEGGVLVAGFSTGWEGREYPVARYDAHLRAAGHEVVERFSTWEGAAYADGDGYAVTVSRSSSASVVS